MENNAKRGADLFFKIWKHKMCSSYQKRLARHLYWERANYVVKYTAGEKSHNVWKVSKSLCSILCTLKKMYTKMSFLSLFESLLKYIQCQGTQEAFRQMTWAWPQELLPRAPQLQQKPLTSGGGCVRSCMGRRAYRQMGGLYTNRHINTCRSMDDAQERFGWFPIRCVPQGAKYIQKKRNR